MKTRQAPARNDRAKMEALNDWPRWPWLPLKSFKNRQPGQLPDFGALHADHTLDGKPRVYFVNVFQVGWFPAPDAKFKEYDDLDAVLADGWQVD